MRRGFIITLGIGFGCLFAFMFLYRLPCYEIIPPTQDTGRQLLLNKCTGGTWMLGRVDLSDAEHKGQGMTYRWSPLMTQPVEPAFGAKP